MRRARAVLWTLLAAAVVVGAAIAAPARRAASRASGGTRASSCPPSWAEYKTSAGHEAHVGQGKAACKDCHDYERDGFKNPGNAPCAKCHGEQAAHAHPSSPQAAKIDCLGCHSFTPNKPSATCIGCHAEPQGALAGIHEHGTTECSSCHTMHAEPFTKTASCDDVPRG